METFLRFIWILIWLDETFSFNMAIIVPGHNIHKRCVSIMVAFSKHIKVQLKQSGQAVSSCPCSNTPAPALGHIPPPAPAPAPTLLPLTFPCCTSCLIYNHWATPSSVSARCLSEQSAKRCIWCLKCTLYSTVQYSTVLFSVHCTLYIRCLKCTLFSVHCTVYTLYDI